MRRVSRYRNLVPKLLRHSGVAAIAIGVFATLVGLVCGVTSTIWVSVASAKDMSRQASIGEFTAAYTPLTEVGREWLQGNAALSVRHSRPADVVAKGRAWQGNIIDGPVKWGGPGLITSGRAPLAGTEVALSPTLASALGVGVGDEVAVLPARQESLRVVGLLVDPASAATATLYRASAPEPEVADEVFLADGNADSHLVEAMDEEGISFRDIARLEAGANNDFSSDTGMSWELRYLPRLVLGLAVLLLSVGALGVVPLLATAEEELVAAGASTSHSRSVGRVAWIIGVGLATLIGWMGGYLVAVTLSGYFARLWGQSWLTTSFDWPSLGLTLILATTLPLVATRLIRRSSIPRSEGMRRVSRLIMVGVLLLAIVGSVVSNDELSRSAWMACGPLMGLMAAGAAGPIGWHRGRMAAVVAREHYRASCFWLVPLVVMIGFLSASAAISEYGARLTATTSAPAQPPGSMVIGGIGPASAEIEKALSQVTGSRAWTFAPNVSPGTVLVLPPLLAACLRVGESWSESEDCVVAETSGIGVPGVVTESGQVRAEPGLVQDGHVVVLVLDGEGKIAALTSLRAIPDPRLGVNSVTALIPAGTDLGAGQIAHESSQRILLLEGVGFLSQAEQAQIVGVIRSLTPSAQYIIDPGLTKEPGQHLMALVFAGVGAMVILALVLPAAVAATLARRPVGGQLVDAGEQDRHRRQRVLRWLAVAAALCIAAGVGGRVSATLWGLRPGVGTGELWLAPPGAGLIAITVVAALDLRGATGRWKLPKWVRSARG